MISFSTPVGREDARSDMAAMAEMEKFLAHTNTPEQQAKRIPAARVAAMRFTTQDPATIAMLERAVWLSSEDCHKINTLILGPSGTGKELMAQTLHGARGSYVGVNCSGITETLFESLLFGHAVGAFTGAVRAGVGMLRQAQGGTLFMDEVGDLPLSQQAKLLRVIQSREATAVGDTVVYPVTCRFVFATHREITNMVALGTFREDLYYRISQVVLRTTSLMSRSADVPLIAQSICYREGYDAECLADLPVERLAARPGNVRAIENYLARRVLVNMSVEEAMEDL